MKQKNLIDILALVLFMAFMPISVLYGQNTPLRINGRLSSDISWQIENETLYLSGKGVVPTTMFGARSAWYEHNLLFHSVVIEDGITGLGQNLFVGYKNITSITIAGSVKDIAPNAFNTCTKLSVVEVKSAVPADINASVFYKLKYKKAKLIVPALTKSTYEADPFWSKFGEIEESNQPADEQPVTTQTLAEPCVIHLTRTTNFFGSGAMIKVFLNGVEQEKIANGKTNLMQTDRDKNELYLQWGKQVLSIRRFNATAGGDVYIEYSSFLAYMKILYEENEE